MRRPGDIYHRLVGSPGSPNFGALPIGACGTKGMGTKFAVKASAITCAECLAIVLRRQAEARARNAEYIR